MSGFASLAALTDHGCSPGQSSLGTLGKVVHCRGAAIGHLEVGVDVNTTGDDHFPIGLDGLHPTRNDQVVSDLPVVIVQCCKSLIRK